MRDESSPLSRPANWGSPGSSRFDATIRWHWRLADRGDRLADDLERRSRLEAALFVADRPLSAARLAKAALLPGQKDVHAAVGSLNASYEADRSPLRVEKLAGGYRLLTRAPFAFHLDQVAARDADVSLSPAALETVTIIAYRQPVTRAEVEAIRGVASLELIKQLMDRRLVKIVGEDDSLGRPFLYGTTPAFLDAFDLRSLDELPDRDSLAA